MPTLTWIGKDKVVNHHHDVPYRVLDHKYWLWDTTPAISACPMLNMFLILGNIANFAVANRSHRALLYRPGLG